jgi:hypothetical protein
LETALAMTREEYQDYLKTEHWQGQRKEALLCALYRCQVCNTDALPLEVHHRTYERLGCELPSDLFVLCEQCHDLFSQNGKLATPEDYGYDEEQTGQGRLQVVLHGCMNHPRLSFGGGSFFLSIAADLVFRLDPLWVFMGLGAAAVIAVKGDDLAEGFQQWLIPGSDQEQVAEDAGRFADQMLESYPVYADQSALAKLKRLFHLEEGKVVDAKKKALPPKKSGNGKSLNGNETSGETGLTVDLICEWFSDGRIDDTQFFDLLDRIASPRLSPKSESGESVKRLVGPREDGESPVKVNQSSETISPDDEQIVIRTAFALQQVNGKVTREDIKNALGWNNKKHWIVKAVCDQYGIAVQGGK